MQVQILKQNEPSRRTLIPMLMARGLVLQLADLHCLSASLTTPGPELPDELEVLGHVRGQVPCQ